MRVAHQCLLSLAANSVYLPYAYMVKAGLFKKTWDSMLVWLACALVDAITVSLVTVIAYGGATGVNGISVLTAALVVAMKNIVLLFHGENLVDSGKEELDDIDEDDDTAEDPAESPLGLSATTSGRTSQGRKADVAFLALGGRPGNQGGGSRSWVNPTASLLNVAVSRAKRRIYVIDNLADWRQGTYTSRIAKDLPAGGK